MQFRVRFQTIKIDLAKKLMVDCNPFLDLGLLSGT